MTDSTAAVRIVRIEGGAAADGEDRLAIEAPLEIRLNGESLSVTMRTPGQDTELAAGFLFCEGLIRNAEEIRADDNVVWVEASVVRDTAAAKRAFVTTSACGVCGKSSIEALESNRCPVLPKDEVKVTAETIHTLPGRLRGSQTVFAATGGLHAAALFSTEGELVVVREDVGRHNALDKLIGWALMEKRMPLRDSILLVSGRASFELVQKALMAGVPAMAAVGAPSSLAVRTAEEGGMTLIGFVKDGRCNVYCGAQRVAAPGGPMR